VIPTFPLDDVRSQRVLKILPEEILAEYDESLYIDNTVILKQTPEVLLDEFLSDCDFALPWHSFRDSVTDEFLEVLRLGLDDGPRLVEQLNHYSMTTPEVLSQRPYWSGILFRRHGVPELQRAMRLWLRHVLRYSRRDQLSINYALGVSGVSPRTIEVDTYISDFHEWPRLAGRDRNARLRHTAESMLPPGVLAQRLLDDAAAASRDMRAAQQQCAKMEAEILSTRQLLESASCARDAANESAARLRAALDAALGEIDGTREALTVRVALFAAESELRDAVARLERELEMAQAAAQALRTALEATHQSTSWRLTAPLRRLSFLKAR